jgi:hypothetical protein
MIQTHFLGRYLSNKVEKKTDINNYMKKKNENRRISEFLSPTSYLTQEQRMKTIDYEKQR